MDAADPKYVLPQYKTDQGLKARIETHKRYGIGSSGGFDGMTQMLAERVAPQTILDMGAGTGNWYRSIRQVLGPKVYYVGLDQSPGMVERLMEMTTQDSNAEIRQGDAQSLDFGDNRFDWVGAHYMLYHVPDIGRAVKEAWRVLKPGGLLAAATNAKKPYQELWDIGEQVARELGLEGDSPGHWMRFHLDNGDTFFPKGAEVVRWDSGFRFRKAEPAVDYMASGPISIHLGSQAGRPDLVKRALNLFGQHVDAIIEDSGVFEVHSQSGVPPTKRGFTTLEMGNYGN